MNYANRAQAINGVDNNSIMTPLRTKEAISAQIDNLPTPLSSYNSLSDKPKINSVELSGNKSLTDLGIVNNIQPDWGQTDTSAGDYIKNKPNIPSGNTTGILSITKFDGNSTCTGSYAKYGNVVSYNIDITTTSDIEGGDNIFEGLITNFYPEIQTTLVGYLGKRAIVAVISIGGDIIIRNASDLSIVTNRTISVCGTFVCVQRS